ncbi:MAG: YvcK family protein [Candidatus Staskawiczbacteria bacterium]|nr:YvcK family protein [Candidatus Staskawiczbacteria bacterium]
MDNKQKIVVIGGGSGSFMVLSGLKKHPVALTAVVTMSDDGGSTGALRDELGVLPPGDVRQCLVALSDSSKTLRDLFNYRYDNGGLKGHSFGNIFISTLEKITGGFDKAVIEASRILRIRGYVFPVTLKNTRLVAELKNGEKIIGEKNIELYKGGGENIKKIYLKPKAELNPRIFKAIAEADKIVISPGDLYTSLIPNFLVNGLSETISKSKAKVIYVVNLMTELGQTNGFSSIDYISGLEKYVGKGIIKHAIFNTELPDSKLLKKYAKYGEKPVIKGEIEKLPNLNFLEYKLLSHKIYKTDKNDKLSEERSLIRHDSNKLAKIIYDL